MYTTESISRVRRHAAHTKVGSFLVPRRRRVPSVELFTGARNEMIWTRHEICNQGTWFDGGGRAAVFIIERNKEDYVVRACMLCCIFGTP